MHAHPSTCLHTPGPFGLPHATRPHELQRQGTGDRHLPEPQRRRIVLIDDDPFQLKLLNLQLRNLELCERGLEGIDAFETSHSALRSIREEGVEGVGLVFCDLHLPGMDGLEVLRHLGELGYRGGIVLISGTSERVLESAERLARSHGLTLIGSIDKPVAPQPLRQVMDRWMPPGDPPVHESEDAVDDRSLRAALSAGQLFNHYQPIVALADGRSLRYEVLLRWQHPTRGLLAPMPFLGAIRDPRLRAELFDHVLNGALRQAVMWRLEGRPAELALNITHGEDNLDLDFPERLEGFVRAMGLPPRSITLDLSFSKPIDSLSTPLEALLRLRLKGFRLSLDRFGTPFACLETLRDVPVDELKLDRGLVREAAQHHSLSAMLATSLDLARRLGMDAAAVGVEDVESWRLLRRLGFDFAQGHLVGAAMTAAELPSWRYDWDQRRGLLLH